MAGPHDKLIADAAKSALGPLNFRRKGRSRTWFADHGWWLTVVEFQPSAWSKGSYLNVAAHWLWSEVDTLSFDFGGRVEEHVEYLSDEQFEAAANRLAEKAAHEAKRLTDMFTSARAAADILLSDAQAGRRHGAGGWMDYNAGVIAALVGRPDSASEMFDRVLKGFAPPDSVLHASAKRMADLAADTARFKREIASLVGKHREALKLPLLDRPAF